jgi:hypothetical protein
MTAASFERVHTTYGYPDQAQMPIPQRNIRQDIQSFATKADALADQILSANQPQVSCSHEPVVIIRHYHSPWYSPFWYYHPQPIFINNSCSDRGRSNNKDRDAQILLGIAATVIGAVAMFALGSAIPRYTDASSELSETADFNARLQYSNPRQQDAELVNEAKYAGSLKERICSRIKRSAEADVALRTLLVAGCGATLAGLIVSNPAFVTAGVVAGLVAGGGMLFKWGFDSSDKQNIRDAHALKGSIQQLNQL